MGEGARRRLGGRARSRARAGRASSSSPRPAGPDPSEGPCATTRRWSEALAAGAAARRHTAPNPWVGCVLVRDGEIVGDGATEPPGRPARRGRGAARRPATAPAARPRTCTLEPCDHHGNTPPCTDALIAAGVARVVVALEDPDARVAGAGFARLRARRHRRRRSASAPSAAARDLAPYLHHRRTGRAVRRRQGRARVSTAASRRPTARRSGSRPTRPAPTRTSCAPTRRRSSSARAPRSPISPR